MMMKMNALLLMTITIAIATATTIRHPPVLDDTLSVAALVPHDAAPEYAHSAATAPALDTSIQYVHHLGDFLGAATATASMQGDATFEKVAAAAIPLIKKKNPDAPKADVKAEATADANKAKAEADAKAAAAKEAAATKKAADDKKAADAEAAKAKSAAETKKAADDKKKAEDDAKQAAAAKKAADAAAKNKAEADKKAADAAAKTEADNKKKHDADEKKAAEEKKAADAKLAAEKKKADADAKKKAEDEKKAAAAKTKADAEAKKKADDEAKKTAAAAKKKAADDEKNKKQPTAPPKTSPAPKETAPKTKTNNNKEAAGGPKDAAATNNKEAAGGAKDGAATNNKEAAGDKGHIVKEGAAHKPDGKVPAGKGKPADGGDTTATKTKTTTTTTAAATNPDTPKDNNGKGHAFAKGHGKGKGKAKAEAKGKAEGKGKADAKKAAADDKKKAAQDAKDAKKLDEAHKKLEKEQKKIEKQAADDEAKKQKALEKEQHDMKKSELKGLEIVAAHGGLNVAHVWLVNADTNEQLVEFKPHVENVIDAHPGRLPARVSVRADCEGLVKSAEFWVNGKTLHLANRHPFLLAGHTDDGSKARRWDFRAPKGKVNTLNVACYSGTHARGAKSERMEYKFKLVGGMLGSPKPIKPIGVCHVMGNGHVVTFNNMYYSYKGQGEYVMFKDSHMTPPTATAARVHVVLDHNVPPAAQLNELAAFVTGVAVRYGPNTFEVSLANAGAEFTLVTKINGQVKPLPATEGAGAPDNGIIVLQKGKLPPAAALPRALEVYSLVIRSADPNEPTHTTITFGLAKQQRYMNVAVTVRGDHSFGHTNGLCANFNGKKNELVAHSGVLSKDSMVTAHTWQVDSRVSLFSVAPPTPPPADDEKKEQRLRASLSNKGFTSAQIKAAEQGPCMRIKEDKKNEDAADLYRMCVDDTLHGESLAANQYLSMETEVHETVNLDDSKDPCRNAHSFVHGPWSGRDPCSKAACGVTHTRRTVYAVPLDEGKDMIECGHFVSKEACNMKDFCFTLGDNSQPTSTPTPGSLGAAPLDVTSSKRRLGSNLTMECNYGNYSDWSECSVTCGNGTATRTRSVLGDAGLACADTTETRECSAPACPADCRMTNYTEWSPCSVSCGTGVKHRDRTIISQPVNGGLACGNTTQTATCVQPACAVDCVLGAWEPWGPCSATCGNGTHTRTRPITTEPLNNGTACGLTTETEACPALPKCAVDCVLSDWSADGACSCGIIGQQGVFSKERTVVRPAANGGKACGLLKIEQPCTITVRCPGQTDAPAPTPLPSTTQYGPMPCEYGGWSPWSKCNAPCGEAQRQRIRQVVGMTGCGPRMEEQPCHLNLCGNTQPQQAPAPGTTTTQQPQQQPQQQQPPASAACAGANWSSWSPCSASCGSGQQTRTRTVPSGCTLPTTQSQPCSAATACGGLNAATIDNSPQGQVILPVMDESTPGAIYPSGAGASHTIIKQSSSSTTHYFNDNLDNTVDDQFDTSPDALSISSPNDGSISMPGADDVQQYQDTVHHLKHRLQKLFKEVQ